MPGKSESLLVLARGIVAEGGLPRDEDGRVAHVVTELGRARPGTSDPARVRAARSALGLPLGSDDVGKRSKRKTSSSRSKSRRSRSRVGRSVRRAAAPVRRAAGVGSLVATGLMLVAAYWLLTHAQVVAVAVDAVSRGLRWVMTPSSGASASPVPRAPGLGGPTAAGGGGGAAGGGGGAW